MYYEKNTHNWGNLQCSFCSFKKKINGTSSQAVTLWSSSTVCFPQISERQASGGNMVVIDSKQLQSAAGLTDGPVN